MITRRDFLKLSGASAAALYASTRARFLLRARAQQGIPLPGSSIPQFIMPLPLLSEANGSMETIIAGTDEITLTMKEFKADMLPPGSWLPDGFDYDGTWVWGYRAGVTDPSPYTDNYGTYIGPVFVASRGTPTQVRFVNDLPGDPNLAWRDWTDQTLHWADPLNSEENHCNHNIAPGEDPSGYCADHYNGPIPAVPHLHGAETPPVLDGGPDAWFTATGDYHGHAYYTHPGVAAAGNEAVYRYLNTQEAAMIWFHDHLLGGTRLNVYAGIAGAYALIDPDLELPTGLHPVGLQQGTSGPVDYLIPMVLQDRSFDTNGQLYFPNVGINPEHPFWVPEFEGDTIVVNGVAWPYLNVEPRRYRFLFINGSNARSYELSIINPVTKIKGPPMWQIGTDGGYLDTPVKIDPYAPKGQLQKLVLMPGERADVIVDFAGLAGQTLLMRNTAHHPYEKGTPPDGATLGRVMVFRVLLPGPEADGSYDPASGIPLRPKMVRLVDPAAGTLATGITADQTRQLTLNEVIGPGGPLEILVNNTKWDGKQGGGTVRTDFTPVTLPGSTITEYYSEIPNEGDTEVWEIVNLTADFHPIHTHLTQFQLINRQKFNTKKYEKAYNAAFPGETYIPAFGPPADYTTGMTFGDTPVKVTDLLGGNPDVTPFLQGPTMPPNANEAGWKDTVQMAPGQVTRIAVRFAPTDTLAEESGAFPFDPNAEDHGFVWHCHIVDHEDNEMMRPYKVNPKLDENSDPITRTYKQGIDY